MRFEPASFEPASFESVWFESVWFEPMRDARARRGRGAKPRAIGSAKPGTALRPCRREGRDGAARGGTGPVQCTGSGSSSNIWVSIQA